MAATPEPSVHNEETTRHPNIPHSHAEYRRASYPEAWQRAAQVYSYLDGRDHTTYYTKLDACRRFAWFARHKATGHVTVLSNGCKLRWCPVCAASLLRVATDAVHQWLKNQQHPKLLTLTLKSTNNSLENQIDRLYSCFRLLRRRSDLKSLFKGGIWYFQVTWSADRSQWHPHLHVLTIGDYTPQKRISAAWQEITKNSTIVDIRQIYKPEKVAAYVARYASQPCKLTDLPFQQAVDAVAELKGRRLCGTYGTAHGLRLRSYPPHQKDDWVSLGAWSTILGLLDTDINSRRIVTAWIGRTTIPEDCTCIDTDNWIAGVEAAAVDYIEQHHPPPLLFD